LVKCFYNYSKELCKCKADNRMQKMVGEKEKESSIKGLGSRRKELYNYSYFHMKHGELEEEW
jgi:hypothetical protein